MKARLLLYLLAASLFLPGEAVAGAASDVPPVLSFVRAQAGTYQWTYRRPDGHEIVLYRSLKLPTHFFWSSDGTTVLFLAGDELQRAIVTATGAEVTSLGPIPRQFGSIEALWIDRATGRARVAAMAQIDGKNVIREAGHIKYRSQDGQKVAGLSRPSWGVPSIVTVLDQNPVDRHWSPISRTGTKSAAGDTPGLSVISAQRIQAGIAIDDLLASYTCDNGQCRANISTGLAAAVSRAVGYTLTADDLSLLPVPGRSSAIVFRTIMGDVAHMTHPVLVLGPGNPQPRLIAPRQQGQIGLAPVGNILLIEDEFTGGNPTLIEIDTAKFLWNSQSATDAVWVPQP